MIKIRSLLPDEMMKAIEIKGICWPEEIQGKSKIQFDREKEYQFWSKWMISSIENNDDRQLYGAFDQDTLLAVIFASFAEVEDSENGIEINGLWVDPKHRNKGLSLHLLKKIIEYYLDLNKNEIIIFNFHYSSSNSFYKKLGANIIKQTHQLEEKVPIDVFSCDLQDMLNNINQRINKYPL